MTEEQKQEKKKPGLTKKIPRWLGLGIITVLFLLALVFDAPPKIFILLLIFLAANTCLPFPYRKYFWLTAACVVSALFIWILLPINNEGWQPYQYSFDKELQKLQKQYSIPPDLDSIKTAAPEEAFLDPVTKEPLQYENHGERFSLYGEKTNVWPR